MKSVMIVEDHPNNMRLFQQILAEIERPLRILEASTGHEAIEQGKKQSADIVIMDISLPDIDGIETRRVLKTLPAFEHSVFIAVTAHTAESDREKLLTIFDYFLAKPVDEDRMIALMEDLLQRMTTPDGGDLDA